MKLFRNPDVMWREEEEYKDQAMAGLEKGEDIEDVGTSVLFSGGTMMSLNILGTEIWKLCDGRTLDEIVRALVEIFDVQPEVLREDAAGFISELKEKGYIYEG
ncbi:MAG: GeoRSP system PqqD family peptide chaperone [Nitrospiraceae bacterium]|nr:MAG: GeoRSP system PqqD family peptide chaperone [Nitrospiraceae bacterium]